MHEIITLQLGQQSNYLATHFWNAQESYFTYSDDTESPVNHDVHFRPGIGADGSETFMPRTVIYDLKGGFGSLRKINALYDVQNDDDGAAAAPQALWNGNTIVKRQEPIQMAAYQRSLETGEPAEQLTPDAVRYWSDFNRVYMHPRSIVQLSDYELNSSLRPFERWPTGGELFSELDREHDLLDRDLRPFVEEADHMQGIQMFTTIDDAWGGFAARYAERLRDEYGKSVIWVWGLQDSAAGQNREKRMLRMSNKAHALAELYKQASILVPFSIPRSPNSCPNVTLDAASPWHKSALLTTAFETAVLPSRMRQGPASDRLDGMADWLNVMGKQTIASLQMDIVRDDEDESAINSRKPNVLDRYKEDLDDDTKAEVDLPIDFTAGDDLGAPQNRTSHKKRHVFGQIISVRGVSAIENHSVEGSQFARQYQSSGRASVRRYYTDLKFPQPDSFPNIYTSKSRQPLKSALPVIASLTTESSTSDRLKLLRESVFRSIDLEDRETLGNELAQMADEYHEGWSSGSDDGDDED